MTRLSTRPKRPLGRQLPCPACSRPIRAQEAEAAVGIGHSSTQPFEKHCTRCTTPRRSGSCGTASRNWNADVFHQCFPKESGNGKV